MGSQESKTEQSPKQENMSKETTPNGSAPSSPILTPLDPRSPSVNIARTPLEVILGTKAEDDPVDAPESYSGETKDIVNVILGVDPRSPTIEFNRTPIIVGAVTKGKSTKLQNKNLENVLRSEIQTTPVTTVRRSSNIVPPKSLESSPVSVVSNCNKRKSFVGLLETNLDFTETDLDTVFQKQEKLNKSLPVEITEDVPCNKLKDQMKALNMKTQELTPESDTNEDKETEFIVDKNLEEKIVNVTAQVKDFDKKLTNLIYEDDTDNETKQSVKITKGKENNRTPLGIRNSNDDAKKQKNRLRVSDKPRKTDVSKIPIFKDNCRKIGVQCENTPPTNLEEPQRKPKFSRWDADKTLII